jgi:hypothetical protein
MPYLEGTINIPLSPVQVLTTTTTPVLQTTTPLPPEPISAHSLNPSYSTAADA